MRVGERRLGKAEIRPMLRIEKKANEPVFCLSLQIRITFSLTNPVTIAKSCPSLDIHTQHDSLKKLSLLLIDALNFSLVGIIPFLPTARNKGLENKG